MSAAAQEYPFTDPNSGAELEGGTTARAAALENTDALLRLLKRRGEADPAYLDEHPPFFFEAEISSNRVDAYFTRMDASTLRNFRDDAKAGISFQNSHDVRKLGFGRSLDASFDAEVEPGVSRTRATFYTVPGLRFHDVTTDDFIGGVRSGILSDVSVGFHGGEIRCDVCGRSLWDWDCGHYPGYAYPVSDWEEGGETPVVMARSADMPATRKGRKKDTEETAIATATYYNSHLSEVSVVYDGATPGAVILKAQRDIVAERMRPEVARYLEHCYRVRLPELRRVVAVGDLPTPSAAGSDAALERQMADQPVVPTPEAVALPPPSTPGDAFASVARDARRFMVAADGAEPPADLAVLQHAVLMASEVAPLRERLATMEARVAELEPQAALGARYREAMIEATLQEGVRALGATFNIEANRQMLASQSLEVIEMQHRQYQAFAAQRFQPGALVSDADPQPSVSPQSEARERELAAAYRV